MPHTATQVLCARRYCPPVPGRTAWRAQDRMHTLAGDPVIVLTTCFAAISKRRSRLLCPVRRGQKSTRIGPLPEFSCIGCLNILQRLRKCKEAQQVPFQTSWIRLVDQGHQTGGSADLAESGVSLSMTGTDNGVGLLDKTVQLLTIGFNRART